MRLPRFYLDSADFRKVAGMPRALGSLTHLALAESIFGLNDLASLG